MPEKTASESQFFFGGESNGYIGSFIFHDIIIC